MTFYELAMEDYENRMAAYDDAKLNEHLAKEEEVEDPPYLEGVTAKILDKIYELPINDFYDDIPSREFQKEFDQAVEKIVDAMARTLWQKSSLQEKHFMGGIFSESE